MFAQHATGKMTLDQAIVWGEKEMQEIYAGRKRRPRAPLEPVGLVHHVAKRQVGEEAA